MSKTAIDGLVTAMVASPILAGVGRTEIGKLADLGAVHRFRAHTYVCHQGDPSPDVYFLVEGRIEISSFSPTGSPILHATVDTPQFLDAREERWRTRMAMGRRCSHAHHRKAPYESIHLGDGAAVPRCNPVS